MLGPICLPPIFSRKRPEKIEPTLGSQQISKRFPEKKAPLTNPKTPSPKKSPAENLNQNPPNLNQNPPNQDRLILSPPPQKPIGIYDKIGVIRK